ncbi:MAG: hypothetical protein H6719_38675, partial [Sandaracinaceae bacterium]|nr:hypothetical protein [Sandaracinaceae bacterium]
MRDAPMIAAALVALSACQAPRVPATRAAPAVAPSPVAAAEPSAVEPADPPGPAASPPADLLRCALDATVYELGEAGDDEPSAPVIVGDDVVVGFTRSATDGSALWVQRAHVAGGLEAAVRVRAGVHASRPPIAGDGARGV